MAEATAGQGGEHPEVHGLDDRARQGRAGTRSQRCNSLARPQFTEDDYKAVHAEEDQEEAAGAAAAADLSPFVYARLKERVIAYALMPSRWTAVRLLARRAPRHRCTQSRDQAAARQGLQQLRPAESGRQLRG